MNISIDLDNVLERIYAESAWHAAYNPGVAALTPDNRATLNRRIDDALADLRQRIDGYVTQWEFNHHLDEGNITIALRLKPHMDVHAAAIKDSITDVLAQFALKSHYTGTNNHFDLAWQVARARITVFLAKNELPR